MKEYAIIWVWWLQRLVAKGKRCSSCPMDCTGVRYKKFSTLFRHPSNSNFRYLCCSTVYFRLSFQVKASSFVGLNEKREVVEGKGEVETSASTIHTGVYQARPDAVCAFHLHPPYSTAIGTAGILLICSRSHNRLWLLFVALFSPLSASVRWRLSLSWKLLETFFRVCWN